MIANRWYFNISVIVSALGRLWLACWVQPGLSSARGTWASRREPSEGPWILAKGLELLSHRGRLKKLEGLSFKKGKLVMRAHLVGMHKHLLWGWKEDGDRLFSVLLSERTRDSGTNRNISITGAVSWAPLHKKVQYCYYGFYFHTAAISMFSLYVFLSNLVLRRSLSFLISRKKPISKRTVVPGFIVGWVSSRSREV